MCVSMSLSRVRCLSGFVCVSVCEWDFVCERKYVETCECVCV